jgi:drug/metabolite transporter (DMT)-like permease
MPDHAGTLQRPAVSGLALVAVSALLFACKGTVIKLVYTHGATVEHVMLLRMVFSMPFYVLVGAVCLMREGLDLSLRQFSGAVLTGIIGYYLASYLDMKGLETVSAGLERIILYTYPVFVLLLSIVVFKKPVSPVLWWCVAVTYAGLFLVFWADVRLQPVAGHGEILKGALYVLLSALSFSVYVIGSDHYMRFISSALFTALAMLSAAFAMCAHYVVTMPAVSLLALPTPVYGWCALTAVLFTVIPSFLMSAGVRQIGSAKAAAVGMVGPVATVIMAAWVLSEPVSLLQMTGLLIVMLGVYRLQHV